MYLYYYFTGYTYCFPLHICTSNGAIEVGYIRMAKITGVSAPDWFGKEGNNWSVNILKSTAKRFFNHWHMKT